MNREIRWMWDVVNMETKYMVDGKVAEEAIIVSDKTEPKKNINILAEHTEPCGDGGRMDYWEMLKAISPFDYSKRNKLTDHTELCGEEQE